MSPVSGSAALSVALNRAIVAHFGSASAADAEEVAIAAGTVLAAYVGGVQPAPAREGLLRRSLWAIVEAVQEQAMADAARRRAG